MVVRIGNMLKKVVILKYSFHVNWTTSNVKAKRLSSKPDMLFILSVKLGGGSNPLRQTCRIPRYQGTKVPRLIVLVTRASRMCLQNKKKTIPSPAQQEEDNYRWSWGGGVYALPQACCSPRYQGTSQAKSDVFRTLETRPLLANEIALL